MPIINRVSIDDKDIHFHPLNPSLGVSQDLQVIRVIGDKKRLIKIKKMGPNSYVETTCARKNVKYRLIDFVHDCMFGTKIDHFIFPLNGNLHDAHPKNIGSQSFSDYLGHPARRHPLYVDIVATESGRIVNASTMTDRGLTTGKGHIPAIKVGRQEIYTHAAQIVYEAFQGKIGEDLKVYHINDDVNDRRLENLVAHTKEGRRTMLAEKILTRPNCRRHPTKKDYIAFDDGRLYSLGLQRFIEGHKNEAGYITIGATGFHKIVYESFHGLVDGKTHHVDHMNNVHDDNRLCNLQKLTCKEHVKKTRADNPQSVKKAGISLSKKVLRIKKSKDGEITECIPFMNISQAVDALKAYGAPNKNTLFACVRDNRQYFGYDWMMEKNELEGEIWKPAQLPTGCKLKISSLGRIEFCNGRRTFGTMHPSGYLSINHAKKHYKVHFLVNYAFNGHLHPTFFGDPKITSDHINRIPSDNRAINCRWATKRQQILNRSCMRIIVAKTTDGDKRIGDFDTVDEAATYFKVGKNVISKLINGITKHSRLLPDTKLQYVTVCRE